MQDNIFQLFIFFFVTDYNETNSKHNMVPQGLAAAR